MGCKNSSRREFKLNFQEKVWRNADLKVWSNSLSPNVEGAAVCAKAKQCNFKCNFAKLPQEAHTRVAHQFLLLLQIWIQRQMQRQIQAKQCNFKCQTLSSSHASNLTFNTKTNTNMNQRQIQTKQCNFN